MADFCKDCSEELFGRDCGDLKGLITEDQWKEGYAAPKSMPRNNYRTTC